MSKDTKTTYFFFPRKFCSAFFHAFVVASFHIFHLCAAGRMLVAEFTFFCEPSKVLSEFLQQPRLKNGLEDVNKIQLLRYC